MKRMRRAAEKGARSTQEKNGRGMQLQRRADPHYKNDASNVKGAIMTTWWPRRAVTAFVEGGGDGLTTRCPSTTLAARVRGIQRSRRYISDFWSGWRELQLHGSHVMVGNCPLRRLLGCASLRSEFSFDLFFFFLMDQPLQLPSPSLFHSQFVALAVKK